MSIQYSELCGAFIDVGVIAVLVAVGVSLLVSGALDMIRYSRKRSTPLTADQKCPLCSTWQSGRGDWSLVGNSDNPEIECWVWIGSGICATCEEINKQKPTPPGDE